MRIFPVDLEILSDVLSNEFVENKIFNTLKTKVNKSDKKLLAATTLILIIQYSKIKQNLEKTIKDAAKRVLGISS